MIIGLALVVAVATVVVAVLVLTRGDEPAGEDYTVVVPAGTAARIAAGDQVELMPERLELSVGDRLVIENRDDAAVTVGPFAVRPGETFRYRFANPGRYIGFCTIGKGNQIEIVVS